MNWINGFELLCYGITLLFLVDVIGERKKRKSEKKRPGREAIRLLQRAFSLLAVKKKVSFHLKCILHDICFRLEMLQ